MKKRIESISVQRTSRVIGILYAILLALIFIPFG